MSVLITPGTQPGRRNPLVSPDGQWQAAGGGAIWVASTANPLVETQLFGENPTFPLYAMGFQPDNSLWAMEVQSIQVATIYRFAPGTWARTIVAVGPYAGNSIQASGGHWSSLGGPLGLCVDGQSYTPTQPSQGWAMDGPWACYLNATFSALIVEHIVTKQSFTLASGAATDYRVVAIDDTACLATFTCPLGSCLWDSRTGQITQVNLSALLKAGIGETAPRVVIVDGVVWMSTWDGGGRWTFLRPLGSQTCVSVNAPGESMALGCDGANLVQLGNDVPFNVVTVLCPLTEPLVAPVVPNAVPAEPLLPVDVSAITRPYQLGSYGVLWGKYGSADPFAQAPADALSWWDHAECNALSDTDHPEQDAVLSQTSLRVFTAGTLADVPMGRRDCLRIGGEGADLATLDQRIMGARALSQALNVNIVVHIDSLDPVGFGLPSSFDPAVDILSWDMFTTPDEPRLAFLERQRQIILGLQKLGVQWMRPSPQFFDRG